MTFLLFFIAEQIEVNKKREQEVVRIRKELEEQAAASEAAMATAKQKFNQALTEAQDELENVKKSKAK